MIYIGAWHKTGTNAIKVLFRKYREKADLDFKFKSKLDRNLNYFIIENTKVVVCIRNPYEIIMSGMRYHQKTKEKWYLRPNDKYNGVSYRDHISSIESIEEKILFEMKEQGYLTITNMYNFVKDKTQYEVYSKTNKIHNINDTIKFIKLEQFMTASGREEIIDIITSHIPTLDKQLLSECITVHGKKKFNSTNPHFNYTYQDYFTDGLYKEFDNLFPDDLFDVLGYLRK